MSTNPKTKFTKKLPILTFCASKLRVSVTILGMAPFLMSSMVRFTRDGLEKRRKVKWRSRSRIQTKSRRCVQVVVRRINLGLMTKTKAHSSDIEHPSTRHTGLYSLQDRSFFRGFTNLTSVLKYSHNYQL